MQTDLEPASPQSSSMHLDQSLSSSIDSLDSQDTVIIEEGPDSKRMKLDDEAKKVDFFFLHKNDLK